MNVILKFDLQRIDERIESLEYLISRNERQQKEYINEYNAPNKCLIDQHEDLTSTLNFVMERRKAMLNIA